MNNRYEEISNALATLGRWQISVQEMTIDSAFFDSLWGELELKRAAYQTVGNDNNRRPASLILAVPNGQITIRRG